MSANGVLSGESAGVGREREESTEVLRRIEVCYI
jgi:hypothetical protein